MRFARFTWARISSTLDSEKLAMRYDRPRSGDTFAQEPSIIGWGNPSATSMRPIVSSASVSEQAKRAIFEPTTVSPGMAGTGMLGARLLQTAIRRGLERSIE